jgi:hypothetical protein
VLEPDFPSFFQPSPNNYELFHTDDISLELDIDSGLGVDYLVTSSTTDTFEHATSTGLLPFDTDFPAVNWNFDLSYDLDFGLVSSPGFDNPSKNIYTVEVDTAQDCMFSSPYLTFRYTASLPGFHPKASALMARQSPFVETQESRLGGNPLGRNLLLENIRSYLTMLARPNSFPPFIHHTALATNEGKNERLSSETICMCCNVAMLYAKNAEQQAFANVWGVVRTEQQRMNKSVSDDSQESFSMITNVKDSTKQIPNHKFLQCSKQ